MPTAKRVPQRRNTRAGTGTPASDKKKKYDADYNASKKQKKKRAELTKQAKKKKSPKGRKWDWHHTKDGRMVKMDRSKNRNVWGKHNPKRRRRKKRKRRRKTKK